MSSQRPAIEKKREKPDSYVLDPVGNCVDAARQMVQAIYGNLELAAGRVAALAKADDVRYSMLKDDVAALSADLGRIRSASDELAARLIRALERRPASFSAIIDYAGMMVDHTRKIGADSTSLHLARQIQRVARDLSGSPEPPRPTTGPDGRVGGK